MPPGLQMTYPICRDCGFSHPPELDGKRCPLAKETTSTGKEVDFSNFFNNLRNMLISKIKEKKIENTEKLFGQVLLEIFKIAESYKEDK